MKPREREKLRRSGHFRSHRGAAILPPAVLGLFLSAVPVAAQSFGLPPATGRLLVATDRVLDLRFQQTVILLVDYDRGGAMGLILNRPTRLSLADGLQSLPDLAEGDFAGAPIYYGGPVAPSTPLALLKTSHPPDASLPIREDLVLTGVADVASRLARDRPGAEPFRIFAGYAGWGAGQLEGEIGRGDWQVSPFDPEAVFTTDPGGLWEKMLVKGERIWL